MPDSSAATEMLYTPRSEVGGLPGLWSSSVIAAVGLSCFRACQPSKEKVWQVKKNICSIPCTRVTRLLYKNLLTITQIIIASSEDYPVSGSRLSLPFGRGNRQEVSQMVPPFSASPP